MSDLDERIEVLALEAALKIRSIDRENGETPLKADQLSPVIADAIRTALNEYAETLKSQDVYHELAARAERIDDLERQLTAIEEPSPRGIDTAEKST